MKEWRELMEERGTRDGHADEAAGRRAASSTSCSRDDAIVASDCGTITTWARATSRCAAGRCSRCSGNLATMANGLPYAIAAQIAYPGPPVRRLRRRRRLHDADGASSPRAVKYELPVKVVIIKNNTLGQIKWEQMVFLGNPEYGCELQPIDFAGVRRAPAAARASRSRTRPTAARSCDEALATPGPVADRGGRRPVRAADAAQGHAGAGRQLRRVAGPGEPNAAARSR